MPRMSNRLTMFVPTMFPVTRPELPWKAASTPTASSGRLLPIATTVRPMTIGGIPIRPDTAVAPRTSSSPPTTRTPKPRRSRNQLMAPHPSVSAVHRAPVPCSVARVGFMTLYGSGKS